jgi:acyl-coenzyme A thioesterase PaaI-like protein
MDVRDSFPKDQSGILPWTRSCFVCGQDNPHGLHLRSRVKKGRVILDYTPRATDLGYKHLVHGGIAITLLDEVMTWASIIAARRVCVAAELTTRLKKPIRVGQILRVEGWVTRRTSRLILTEGILFDSDGRALLTAEGKYMPMPKDQIELTEDDFVLSAETIRLGDLLGKESQP